MDVEELAHVFDALCLRDSKDGGDVKDRDARPGDLIACAAAARAGGADARARATRVVVYREPNTNEVTAALLVLVDAFHAQHCVAVARPTSTCPWGRDLGLVYDGTVTGGRLVIRASSCQAIWFTNRVLLPRLQKLYCAG